VKTKETYSGIKNNIEKLKRHNGNDVYCMDVTNKQELKYKKEKCTKGSKTKL